VLLSPTFEQAVEDWQFVRKMITFPLYSVATAANGWFSVLVVKDPVINPFEGVPKVIVTVFELVEPVSTFEYCAPMQEVPLHVSFAGKILSPVLDELETITAYVLERTVDAVIEFCFSAAIPPWPVPISRINPPACEANPLIVLENVISPELQVPDVLIELPVDVPFFVYFSEPALKLAVVEVVPVTVTAP